MVLQVFHPIFDFLSQISCTNGEKLMINSSIRSMENLEDALNLVLRHTDTLPDEVGPVQYLGL